MNSLKVEKRFGLVPNSILNSKKLSFRAKLTFYINSV